MQRSGRVTPKVVLNYKNWGIATIVEMNAIMRRISDLRVGREQEMKPNDFLVDPYVSLFLAEE